MTLSFPVEDGTKPTYRLFNARQEKGILPKHFDRPLNDLKRDARIHLGHVSTSLDPKRIVVIDPIPNLPVTWPIDLKSFIFICVNNPDTSLAQRTCSSDPTAHAFTAGSRMALCPMFFAPVYTGDLSSSRTDHERKSAIRKAVWRSVQNDKDAFLDSSARGELDRPMSNNPGKLFICRADDGINLSSFGAYIKVVVTTKIGDLIYFRHYCMRHSTRVPS